MEKDKPLAINKGIELMLRRAKKDTEEKPVRVSTSQRLSLSLSVKFILTLNLSGRNNSKPLRS